MPDYFYNSGLKRSLMKLLKKLIYLTGILIYFISSTSPVYAQTQTPAPVSQEPAFGLPLCQAGPYLYDPKDCLPLGPSETISQMAQKGIVYPFIPLQVHKPDSALNDTDLKFAKIPLLFMLHLMTPCTAITQPDIWRLEDWFMFLTGALLMMALMPMVI
jgi:hypothetical protein